MPFPEFRPPQKLFYEDTRHFADILCTLCLETRRCKDGLFWIGEQIGGLLRPLDSHITLTRDRKLSLLGGTVSQRNEEDDSLACFEDVGCGLQLTFPVLIMGGGVEEGSDCITEGSFYV